MDKERVLLIVQNYVVNGGEGDSAHGVLAVWRRVDVEMFATVGRRKGRNGVRDMLCQEFSAD